MYTCIGTRLVNNILVPCMETTETIPTTPNGKYLCDFCASFRMPYRAKKLVLDLPDLDAPNHNEPEPIELNFEELEEDFSGLHEV